MRVEEIMIRDVTCCRPDDTLHHAARLMWEFDRGSLPVCPDESPPRVTGMITDRDICMAAWTQGKVLADLRVSDCMASQVVTCAPGDSLADVERKLREARVRRLPVVDEAGVLRGIICLADLALEASREQNLQVRQVTATEVSDALASICTPADRPSGSAASP